MNRLSCMLSLVALSVGQSLAPAWADSTSSAASSAASASVGSVSDSVQSASRSVTGQKVAQGDYRIVRVEASAEDASRWQLWMEGSQESFLLRLPHQLVARHGLVVGTSVRVTHERFGLAFALQGANAVQLEPFFLALAEGFTHELDRRAVKL